MLPLVTVIIPCYNHGHYMGKAIESVLGQSYGNAEVVVVDDGSWDNTREVALGYGDRVRYVHKKNAGLSAARNTGLEHAKGDYIVFLDADDWLYPKALEINLGYLLQNPKAAFVSGGYTNYYENEKRYEDVSLVVEKDHYLQLLQGNYIGMIAAVMYQKWVLEELRYDESLRACEDYDLYLRITRKYPVVHHTQPIAYYRRHTQNMSGNDVYMLENVLETLKKHKKYISARSEAKAYNTGIKIWKKYYCGHIYYKKITGVDRTSTKKILYWFFKNSQSYFYKYLFYSFTYRSKLFIKKIKIAFS